MQRHIEPLHPVAMAFAFSVASDQCYYNYIEHYTAVLVVVVAAAAAAA